MDDPEVIETFLDGAAGGVFGPSLHLDRGTLKLDGWWPLAYRISARAFILRDEDAPGGSTAPFDIAAAMVARGLQAVGADLPAITALTYTNLDLGFASWVLWSTDLPTGTADLEAKVGEESFFGEGGTAGGPEPVYDVTSQASGAWRLAGDAARAVVTVGLGDDWREALESGLVDCRFEHRDLDGVEPEACGALLPSLVVVDATTPAGQAFTVALWATKAVSGPIVALTEGGDLQAGADATADAATPAGGVELVRDLLH